MDYMLHVLFQVIDQGIPKDSIISFKLRAKFYPEDVTQLVMEVTLHFFYTQVSHMMTYCYSTSSNRI